MVKDTLETLLEEFVTDIYKESDRGVKVDALKAAMFDELVLTLALVNVSLNEHIRRFTNPEFEGFAKAEKTLSKANRIKGVIDDE